MTVKTPPMGWNSWNTFGENINEQLIMEIADAMVSTGLKDAGYEYVVIDDCWSAKSRDENGDLVADPVKFPHGLKYLADYIHARGLKFGIYGCCGPRTCAGYPGSLDHELQDALFFARNEIDFLKYDWCTYPRAVPGWTLYNRIRMALNATGRDILLSICNWGEQDTLSWARSVGADMYRSTYDISDSFDIVRILFNEQKNNMCLSGPSCFNDMDMLICGMYGKGNVANGGCNDIEYRTHFAMWCMLSQPLMIGCDIRSMTEETRKLLTDAALIAIDQDAEVRPPIIAANNYPDRYPTMFKHLSDGSYAIGIFNISNEDTDVGALWLADIGLSPRDGYAFRVYDTESGELIGEFDDMIKPGATIPAHGCKVLRAYLVKKG
ncbi:MAG: glycoside hydrolase family 27 protein [Clostridia bacterium]|nr:glycoside hydrolase family 27 protein [Clostridia bacterium]